MGMVNDEVFWNEKKRKTALEKDDGFSLQNQYIPYAMHIYYVPLKNS